MLVELLGAADWTTPPPEMEFSATYEVLLRDVAETVQELKALEGRPSSPSSPKWLEAPGLAVFLYVRAPAIVNVMLNYKICVEHDLPLHPTLYYELKEARKYRIDYDIAAIDEANRLYRRSIDLARAALRLDASFGEQMASFHESLPSNLRGFVYTGIRDAYTWRGSDPGLLVRLAKNIEEEFKPDIIVAAAHGSIMPALLLSELMEIPLYFIRFSMFKRNDEEPILTFSDQAWLLGFKSKKALLYDEDVAGGRTLTLFSERMASLFSQTRTACSIRHAGATIKPDFCAKIWWD